MAGLRPAPIPFDRTPRSLYYSASVARRDGREVEGTPLLREHTGKTRIEGSNPSLSAKISLQEQDWRYNSCFFAPVAQLDRVPGYEPGGRGFESCRARQTNTETSRRSRLFLVRHSHALACVLR